MVALFFIFAGSQNKMAKRERYIRRFIRREGTIKGQARNIFPSLTYRMFLQKAERLVERLVLKHEPLSNIELIIATCGYPRAIHLLPRTRKSDDYKE